MIRSGFAMVLIGIALLAKGQSSIDVLHYRFEIELSDRSDSIKGRAQVTVQFTEEARQFWLNLVSPNSKGKGMTAYQVKDNNNALAFAQGKDTLNIHLKKPAQKGETRTFEIFYQGVPADGLIISKNPYGDRTFFADNWPNRAHNWIPCKDEPDDKATFEFIITAPNEYKVVSNGKLEEEKDLADNMKLTHWVENVSLPTKVMVIGVARFAVKEFEDSPPNIPVSAWTYPQDSSIGFEKYSVAPAAIKFFSDYIGPYPYNKLANVQSKTIFGGMENASAIFYFEESAEETKPMDDIISHEIAHQWFGDMASEKNFSHLWLSEGFATFFENMFIGAKYGNDSMTKRFIEDRKKVIDFARQSNRPVVDSVSPVMSLLNANSYQKGGWVLRMLQHQLGDSLFQKFIRAYYDRYKGKNANTNDLEQVAEQVGHRDLKLFFNQWLYTPGLPLLDIEWSYDEKGKSVSITVNQLQKQDPFEFPLELKLSDAGSQVVTLNISKRSETFSVPAASAVTEIIADPNSVLLFDWRVKKE